MRKAYTSIQYLWSFLVFLFSVVFFKLSGKNISTRYLHRTFFGFGGIPGTVASRFLGKRKNPNLAFEDFHENQPRLIDSIEELKNQGYSVRSNFLSREESARIIDFSLETLGAYKQTDSGQSPAEKVLFRRDEPLALRYDYEPSVVLKCKEVQKVLTDERVLSLAQSYLGREPILDFVALWWNSKSTAPDKKAAQYFHFDMDRLRWLKFFFYVTDVKVENGPHVFVPTSHRDFGIPFSLRKRGYVRLRDEEVEPYYEKSKWKTFTGKAGDMIVEDTRGLHKGSQVVSGDRLVLQLQFTSTLYGASEEPDNMEISKEEVTSELIDKMAKYPYVYQKIKLR